jgi:hypothetical protein
MNYISKHNHRQRKFVSELSTDGDIEKAVANESAYACKAFYEPG